MGERVPIYVRMRESECMQDLLKILLSFELKDTCMRGIIRIGRIDLRTSPT